MDEIQGSVLTTIEENEKEASSIQLNNNNSKRTKRFGAIAKQVTKLPGTSRMRIDKYFEIEK